MTLIRASYVCATLLLVTVEPSQAGESCPLVRAAQLDMQIQEQGGAVCLTIKDDGQGFHQERVLHSKKGKRLGLLGMRERLEMVGGQFSVSSAPGKGTTVVAQIPLIDPASRGGGRR